MRQCPHCGEQVSDNARACGHCGRWLTEQSAPPPPVVRVPQEPVETPASPVTEPSAPVPDPKPVPAPSPQPPVQEVQAEASHPATPTLVEQTTPAPAAAPASREPPAPVRTAPPRTEQRTPADQIAPVTTEPSAQAQVVPPGPPAPQAKRRTPGWVWGLVSAVVIVAVVAGLVLTGTVELPSLAALQPTPTRRPPTATPTRRPPTRTPQPTVTPVPAIPTPQPTVPTFAGTCERFSDWGDIGSKWLGVDVDLDGRMTHDGEWIDSACADLVLHIPEGLGEHAGKEIDSRWWFKNDEEWIYILARIPVESFDARAAFLNYFWSDSGAADWDRSDGGSFSSSGNAADTFGWTEEGWIDDTDAGGTNDTEGAAGWDGDYYWFEFRKRLNSGDEHDWQWSPGDAPHELGSVIPGTWGYLDGDGIWFELYTALYLAEP